MKEIGIIHYETIETGETVKYIPLPKTPYSILEDDFTDAKHFSSIKDATISDSSGVLVKAPTKEDGLKAAVYLLKKLEQDEDFDEEEWELDEDEPESFYDAYGNLYRIPVITIQEFLSTYSNGFTMGTGMGHMSAAFGEQNLGTKPYWFGEDYPLIIMEKDVNSFYTMPLEHFKKMDRFIIYISLPQPSLFSNEKKYLDACTSEEKQLIFELDYEFCHIAEPNENYYEWYFRACVKSKRFTLSKKVSVPSVIELLRQYRKERFSGCQDITMLINRVTKRKQSNKLTEKDFHQALLIMDVVAANSSNEPNTSDELHQLIGLDDVKRQLHQTIQQFKFEKKRRNQGLPVSDSHFAAVFMGSPGTAKTTVARLFGKILQEEGVLERDYFMEISRKDLIGLYVGHTAPKVEEIFQQAKGGSIFIDEAYSLLSTGAHGDNFSDEAMAELIRQMENNPNTLVIFAGYTNEMKKFILEANPGLRSRLTNMIYFKDYCIEEMCEIFDYFVAKEKYILEDKRTIHQLIHSFLKENKYSNLGNGRLIRKLFKACITSLAMEATDNLDTITIKHVHSAIENIVRQEGHLKDCERMTKIGFIH